MAIHSGNWSYDCPNCNSSNKLILMGDRNGTFEKICKVCDSKLEVILKDDEIKVLVETKKEKTVKQTKLPRDYVKYEGGKDIFKNKPTVNNTKNIITILIIMSSFSGFATGSLLMDFFSDDYNEYKEIKIEIVVRNNTADLNEAIVVIDSNEVNQTYIGNGTYNIFVKPGKHVVEINVNLHKQAIMQIFIPPQDNNLSLIDINQGIDGVNRFVFTMEEGMGTINLEDAVYVKVESWCPNLIFLFSAIGLWGAWVTYNLQSYKNAQIGTFFSILATGFLIVGPILGIIALIMLYRNKNLFTASFKN